MTDAPPNRPLESARRNQRVATIVVAVAVAMVGAAYAAVPLYAAFCKATGYGGTTQLARVAPAARGARTLSVSFDANVAPGLDWTFEPESPTIVLRTGATATVYFRVHNRSTRETAAVAVFNVAPENSGAWFDKVSCFCFSEQHLGPNETAELPVVFFLDPRLEQDYTMNDVAAITLSYTLFAANDAAKPVALAPQAGGAPPRL
jgi:cytochrome c oxidase assembly protein subunit 11